MKAKTWISIAGAIVGVLVGTAISGPPDIFIGACYGMMGGFVALGICKIVQKGRS